MYIYIYIYIYINICADNRLASGVCTGSEGLGPKIVEKVPGCPFGGKIVPNGRSRKGNRRFEGRLQKPENPVFSVPRPSNRRFALVLTSETPVLTTF